MHSERLEERKWAMLQFLDVKVILMKMLILTISILRPSKPKCPWSTGHGARIWGTNSHSTYHRHRALLRIAMSVLSSTRVNSAVNNSLPSSPQSPTSFRLSVSSSVRLTEKYNQISSQAESTNQGLGHLSFSKRK